MIINFDNLTKFKQLFTEDTNKREISIYKASNLIAIGETLYYPNVLFCEITGTRIIKPIKETTMSLKTLNDEQSVNLSEIRYSKEINTPMFFFVYNTDNYYHFIYDTLPYLISYIELKKTIPDIKLLMNYPNQNKDNHYAFVVEFLELIGISLDNIELINSNTCYKELYFSTSYTHDFNSNLPPRNEIYDLYANIVKTVKSQSENIDTPKKIYVSRRSWIHGNLSNIGTNYTSRRKLVNEDDLVGILTNMGYIEVFTETMSTSEKILLFANAEKVIGAIGGGLCNVLFSPNETDLIALVSPCFLEINDRFKYSFKNVNTLYFNETRHVETNEFKKYMRVKFDNFVGEIIDIIGDEVTIAYSESKITGWNSDVIYNTKTIKISDCIKLDDGLNSSWEVNLTNLKNYL